MKQVALPLLLICALSACGNSDQPNSDTASVPEPSAKTEPNSQSNSKTDPETPADQFVVMSTTQDCLGIYANLAPADGKQRAIVEYTAMEDSGFRKLEGFSRADKVKAMEGPFDAAIAPMKGKTLFTYTTSSNDDYREYNMENKAFFDSTQLTWGSSDPLGASSGNNELGLTKGDGHCVLQLVNTENWKSQFKVDDEAQARAADAARQAGNGHVKYYLKAVTADAANNNLDWPRVRAEIVRVELVDNSGNLLARAHPSL